MNRIHRAADDPPELNQGIWRRRLRGHHSLGAKKRSQALVEPGSDHGLRTAGAVYGDWHGSAVSDLGTGDRNLVADTTARVGRLYGGVD